MVQFHDLFLANHSTVPYPLQPRGRELRLLQAEPRFDGPPVDPVDGKPLVR